MSSAMLSAQGRPWWRSLGFRLNAWYIGVLLLVMLLGTLGAGWVMQRSINLEQNMIVKAELRRYQLRIAQRQKTGGAEDEAGLREAVAVQSVTTTSTSSNRRLFVRVADEHNRTLAYAGAARELEFSAQALQPGQGERTIKTIGRDPGQPWTVAEVRLDAQHWLQLGMDDRPRLALSNHAQQGWWVLLVLSVVLGTLGGMLLTSRALAPLRALADTSRKVVLQGALGARVPRSDNGDELDELSNLFNQVLDKNQRLVVGMREALDNVAHDLRTPLSRLRSGAELALNQADDAERMREALADCLEESERVQMMLTTLMDISEAETGVMRLELETVDLQQIASDAIALYQHVAEEREISLTLSSSEPVKLKVDPQRMTQVVANLLDNALKYTDPRGRVNVEVSSDATHAELAVTDTGIGIEAIHLDKIWQRLYRADASRSRRGLGLGLSFVRAVVEAHGGSVHARSSLGQGSSFTIRLRRLTPLGSTGE